jgi:hypothetical protein
VGHFKQKSTAAGQDAQSTIDRRDHSGSQTLLDLCRVLEELPKFLECVSEQMGEYSTGGCKGQKQQRKPKLVDVKISVRRLNRAADLWWKIDGEDTWAPSALSSAETVKALTSAFAVAFPECVAITCNDRWYAAGHRARGAALKSVEDEDVAILLEAKPSRWKKDTGNSMAHLKPLFCMPGDPNSLSNKENVVIISDSTLQLPGVMYGIACELRKIGCNLLRFVTKGGAGAQERKDAWEMHRFAIGV